MGKQRDEFPDIKDVFLAEREDRQARREAFENDLARTCLIVFAVGLGILLGALLLMGALS